MDWDNITQTGARATGVEEGTLHMVVHLSPILPDSEREIKEEARCTKDRGKASEPPSMPGAGLTGGT
jgi:hypothetical protein